MHDYREWSHESEQVIDDERVEDAKWYANTYSYFEGVRGDCHSFINNYFLFLADLR
jgi:hypothetical protein